MNLALHENVNKYCMAETEFDSNINFKKNRPKKFRNLATFQLLILHDVSLTNQKLDFITFRKATCIQIDKHAL